MKALQPIVALGYEVSAHMGNIKLWFVGNMSPDPAVHQPLVEALRARKLETLAYLFAEEGQNAAKQFIARETIATAQPSTDEFVGLPTAMAHPQYRPGVPISQQPEKVEELWARLTFAGLGILDPGTKPDRPDEPRVGAASGAKRKL